MKTLVYRLALSLIGLATTANADQIVNVDGEDYFLSHLMANCQSIEDDPAAQISCFAAISELLGEEPIVEEKETVSVVDALETLRSVAYFQDDDTGLMIGGSDCKVHIVYYGNYFHISRRNISSVDLFSTYFDASQLQLDQTVELAGGQLPFLRGKMADGSVAAMRGGFELDSSLDNFEPRSPRMSLDVYANEVVAQLQPRESQVFDFVLVHPMRTQDSQEILNAFQGLVEACSG